VLRTMLQAKLHRVTVTQADLHYEGSCGIDRALLAAASLHEFQHIDIYNVSNGSRFSTYIIEAPAGSGEISLNGAAARKAMVGDLLIICTYSQYSESELVGYEPTIVFVDSSNHIVRVKPARQLKAG
jgi:aspartate 1-decarboxylase